MALVESRYKAAARAEIERDIRQLEERGKIKYAGIMDSTRDSTFGNVDFSQRISLISDAQAKEYRSRIQAAEIERQKLERNETRDIVNDFENPRERAARYQGLDQYNTEIRREREKNNNGRKAGEKPPQRGGAEDAVRTITDWI